MSAIGERLFLDSATLTPLLKRMQQAGLLERNRSGTDERQVIISLTDAGRALAAEAAKLPATMLGAAGCSAGEASELRERLQALRDRLLAHEAGAPAAPE